MESLLSDKWEVKLKHVSEEVLRQWRDPCSISMVKNRKSAVQIRSQSRQAEQGAAMLRTNQEKYGLQCLFPKLHSSLYKVEVAYHALFHVLVCCFHMCADDLETKVESHYIRKLMSCWFPSSQPVHYRSIPRELCKPQLHSCSSSGWSAYTLKLQE